MILTLFLRITYPAAAIVLYLLGDDSMVSGSGLNKKKFKQK